MLKTKRFLCVMLAAIMLLFTVGCSTPAVAIKVGDREYSTGEYLAYLYNATASMVAYNYYMTGDMSSLWKQTTSYTNTFARETSGDDEGEQVSMAEYFRRSTKDTILYMAAIESLMAEYGIELSDENKADAENNGYSNQLLAVLGFTATDSYTRALGFSLDNYKKMYMAVNYNEKALLHGLYGKGGKLEVPEEKLRAYFDENYLVYEIIQIALVDSDGNPLEADKEAEVRARIDEYMSVYQQTGDFDKAIEAYDNYGGENTTNDETSDVSDETSDVSDEVSEPELNEDGTAKNVTTNRSANVSEIDGKTYTDQSLVEAIRSVPEGEVKIVEYKQNGNDNMLALIYRIDADGTGRETYYDDSQEELLQKVCEDDFKKLIWDKMDAQAGSVKIDQRAIDMCKPENFFASNDE